MQLGTSADEKGDFLSTLVNTRQHWALCRERNKGGGKERAGMEKEERMSELCVVPRSEVCVSFSSSLSFVESFL